MDKNKPVINPIETLRSNINRNILIKVKRNRRFVGLLRAFDNHLNVQLENSKYYYNVAVEEGKFEEREEEFPEVIIRGDNIVFIGTLKE